MEGLWGAPTMEHPNYELISFLFIHGRKGNAPGVLAHTYRDHHRPVGYYSNETQWQKDSLPACDSHDMQTDEIVLGFSLTI